MSRDAITLTIPHDRPFYGVARLVVGGIAARLDLSFEHLEDLQLALESLLDNDAYAVGESVTVELVVGEDAVQMSLGPVAGSALRADLAGESEADEIGLARLLGAVVEGVAVEEREAAEWVRFEKRIAGGGEG